MMIDVAGGNAKYYYYHNEIGSVIALLHNDGTVAEAYSYDSFGKPYVHTGAGIDGVWLTSDDSIASSPVSAYGNCWLFTARQWDAEGYLSSGHGLYYYRARMYHPVLGRFLQPDPIGYADSMNLYQYCLNNAINRIDPYGLDVLVFDPGSNTLNRWGNSGLVGSYPATSGRTGVTDSSLVGKGPIPPGWYRANPSEITDRTGLRRLRDLAAREDWGRRRAPLHPKPGTNTKGRSGFFLHGGNIPGSAGCIDVGNKDVELMDDLKKHEGPIPVQVVDPSEKECGPVGDFPSINPQGGSYA